MKGFVKLISLLFSFIVIVISVVIILYIARIISIGYITDMIGAMDFSRDTRIATIIVAGILGVLGVITIASSDNSDDISNGGLILPLEIGKVCISNQTFENIIIGVTRKYAQFRNVKVNVGVNENGLVVNVYVYITPETVVADVTAKLQQDIKVSVLKQTTVEVKEIDIKVKGVINIVDRASGASV